MDALKSFCQEIFYGSSERSLRARYALLGLDITILAYFIVTTFTPLTRWVAVLDFVIACVLLVELPSPTRTASACSPSRSPSSTC